MNRRTLIIPCGGRGVRMGGLPFPKCLLPVAQRPILFRIMNTWRPVVDRAVVVVSPENERVIRRYVDTYWREPLPVDFAVQPRPTGTYFAVREALRHVQSPGVVLNWCDLLPTAIPSADQLDAGNWIFTSNNAEHCRWEFADGGFRLRESGPGVLGVFALREIDAAFRPEFRASGAAETEILEALDPHAFRALPWDTFLDIGDASRYTDDVRTGGDVRPFGSEATIEWQRDRVVKRHANPARAQAEADWYASSAFDFTPQVLGTNPLTLQRLDAEPCGDWLERNATPRSETEIAARMFAVARKIHGSRSPRRASAAAVRAQYIEKTRRRLSRARFLVEHVDAIDIVEGQPRPCPFAMLDRLERSLDALMPESFHFLHGDLQLSNTLIDGRGRLHVVDPRGSFADEPDSFGDALYDFAKIYYGLCGNYGAFSRGAGRVTLAHGAARLAPLLDPRTEGRRRRIFAHELGKISYLGRGMAALDLVHALIWLSVTDFIANDVLSSLYAHLHGVRLLHEALADQTAARRAA